MDMGQLDVVVGIEGDVEVLLGLGPLLVGGVSCLLETENPNLEMADYLLPTNEKLTIEEKRNLFAIRNRMVDICSNFSKSEVKPTCVCGEIETMKHVYICEILNEKTVQSEVYENIYNGNIRKQIEVFRKFEENLNKYNILKKENQQ